VETCSIASVKEVPTQQKNKYEMQSWKHSSNTAKVKVKVNFALEQATKAQRGGRGIALLFLQSRCYVRRVVNATPPPL
jgi:hypothetical protein